MSAATLTAGVGQSDFAEKKAKTRGRPQLSVEKERINLSLSPKSLERLDQIMEKTEASSYGEVIRNALRLYDAFIGEAERGNEFLIRDQNGVITSYKVFY
jgi:Arc/MetJ-type ribon-helix-helix transcriptional regulator